MVKQREGHIDHLSFAGQALVLRWPVVTHVLSLHYDKSRVAAQVNKGVFVSLSEDSLVCLNLSQLVFPYLCLSYNARACVRMCALRIALFYKIGSIEF